MCISNPGYPRCWLTLYLTNFLHSEVTVHSLRNLLIIQEGWVFMVFSRPWRWESAEPVNIDDKTANLLHKVWAFAHRLCDSKAQPSGRIFNVQNAVVAFEQLKVIPNCM